MDVVIVVTCAREDVSPMTEPCSNSTVDDDAEEDCGVTSKRQSYDASRVIDRCFNRVHVGARECSSIVALVVSRMELHIHEATNVREVLSSPRMHHAMDEIEVRFTDMSDEKEPEDALVRRVSEISVER